MHADSDMSGTAYMTINGLDQGFETDGDWSTMELSPAGMAFTGDMSRMQVYYGLYGYGATHTVSFRGITVTGCCVAPVGGVWVPINKFDLLGPWITLASLITVATASVVYSKHKRKQQ